MAPKNIDESQQSLEKIRDLLFGEETRESKRRLEQLEKRLVRELRGIESRLEERVEAVEKSLGAEVAALTKALQDETEQRAIWDEDLVKKIGDLGKRVTRLNENQQAALREMRQKLQGNIKAAKDDVLVRCDEMSAGVDEELDELREAKTDRADLAAVLQDLAARLAPQEKA